MKIFSKKKGISSLAALLTLLSLTAMGTVITYLVAAGEEGRINHILSTQAFYVTQAGIEYGLKKIYEGTSPVTVSPVTFGEGSFSISQSGITMTVTGTVGSTTRAHSVDQPTQADCVDIDVSNANLGGGGTRVQQITFSKVCLTQITITTMQYSWVADGGERIELIKIEEDDVYDNPAGAPSGTLLDITNIVLTNGNNNVINRITWDESIEGKVITMIWTFGDNTSKTVTFGPLS